MTERPVVDIETRLAAWLASRAPAAVPVALAERAAAIPLTSPAGGWLRRRLRLTPTSTRGRAVAMAALVAVVAIGAVAGALLLRLTMETEGPVATPPGLSPAPLSSDAASPTPPRPTPTAIPTSSSSAPFRGGGLLPATIADDVPHGIVDTPIGRVRWAHQWGDAATLPDPLVPTRGPDGLLVWFRPGGQTDICFNGGQDRPECVNPPGPSLEVSTDLLAPREARPLPVSGGTASLLEAGGWYWLLGQDPASVWRSRDLRAWEATDLTGIRPPATAGLTWTLSPSWVASVDGAAVAQFQYTAVDPGRLLGFPGRNVYLRHLDGGYVAREIRSTFAGGDRDLGAITVTEVDGGLRFADATGREVGRLDGVGLDFAEAWAAGWLHDDRLATLVDGRWEPAGLPGMTFGDSASLIGWDGAFLAYTISPAGTTHVWRSTDGLTWTGGAIVVDESGQPLPTGGVWSRDDPGGTVIYAASPDGTRSWDSTDGEHFAPAVPPADEMPPTTFDGGAIQSGVQTGDGSWLVSRDGTTWEEAPALRSVVTKLESDGAGGSSEASLGNVVFYSVEEMGGRRDQWILEFEVPGG